MKKEGIQTRKRKPKNHSGMSGSLAGPSGMHKTEIKSNLLGESSVSKFVIKFLFRSLFPPKPVYLSISRRVSIVDRYGWCTYGSDESSFLGFRPFLVTRPLSLSLYLFSLSLSLFLVIYMFMC